MKLKLHLIFLFLVFLSINSCCRKPECKCKEEWGESVKDCTLKHFGPYYLGVIKDYLYFKKGSWWVYKNNLSGEKDSIYTVYCDTNVINSTNSTFRWLTMTYTDINFRLKSATYNTIYTYYSDYNFPSINQTKFRYQIEKNANFIKSSKNSPPFVYPFEKDITNLFQEIIPTMTIQGKTYNDIAVFQVSRDESVQHPINIPYDLYFQSNSKYYWAKDVGLIMIKCETNRRDNNQPIENKWELTNYNLVI